MIKTYPIFLDVLFRSIIQHSSYSHCLFHRPSPSSEKGMVIPLDIVWRQVLEKVAAGFRKTGFT